MESINKRSIEQKVLRFIRAHKLIQTGDSILVALSGGADSVGLLTILNRLSSHLDISLAAAHLHHGFRGSDADEDQTFCSGLCKNLNIPFHTKKMDVADIAKKENVSFEVAGRNIRYHYFSELCTTEGYTKIATGHIISDNTETLILNLCKGTGPSGMRGIPVQRGNIIRPLLVLSKDEITDYLNTNGINFRQDKTNEETFYYRNRIRHEIIPKIKETINPALDESLLRFATLQKEMISVIENQLLSSKVEQFITKSENSFSVHISVFEALPDILIGELCRLNIIQTFGTEFSYEDYRHILSLKKAQTGISITISDAIEVIRDREQIIFRTLQKTEHVYEQISIGETLTLHNGRLTITYESPDAVYVSNDSNTEFFDADQVISPLKVKTWQVGDNFVPLGMTGTKKISDFLTDLKLPVIERKKQLVLKSNNDIIWVIGRRIDNRYKVTKKSKQIIKCKWEPNAG